MRVLWITVAGVLLCLVWGTGCRASGPARATVTIDSVPEGGATVTIGDDSFGVTPAVITTLSAGTYFVSLEKDGYKRAVEPIDIPAAGEARFSIKMTLRVGYLSIESDPSPSTVTLDGSAVLGETPLVRKAIPIGKHTYTVSATRRIPESKTLEIEEDYQYKFKHILKPTPAKLTVYSTPASGQISLNNQDQATITPATFELQPGRYLVSVYARGFVATDQTITLDPSEEETVEIKLLPGDVPPGMALIPAGEFLMGLNGPSPDERPQRKVMLNAYYIDKCEVTNVEFRAVFPSFSFPEGEERLPVTGVTFFQASDYALAVGKRLPTEAEWEKAARGIDGREYPWGTEFDPNLCNSKASGFGKLREVGQYFGGASPYGCMDMAGNAYEWTSSWYQAYEGNTDIHTSYGQEFRVVRGGSYLTGFFELRCARRHFDRPDASKPDYSFRCARDVDARTVKK